MNWGVKYLIKQYSGTISWRNLVGQVAFMDEKHLLDQNPASGLGVERGERKDD